GEPRTSDRDDGAAGLGTGGRGHLRDLGNIQIGEVARVGITARVLHDDVSGPGGAGGGGDADLGVAHDLEIHPVHPIERDTGRAGEPGTGDRDDGAAGLGTGGRRHSGDLGRVDVLVSVGQGGGAAGGRADDGDVD